MNGSLLALAGRVPRAVVRRCACALTALAFYRRTFSGIADALRYYRLLHRRPKQEELVPLQLRPLGNRVIRLRNNVCDNVVLHDVFFHGYHLPRYSLPPRPIILDLGSNIGLTMAHFACLFPGSRIVGVEMDSGNFDLLQANLRPFENCHAVRAAVWVEENQNLPYGGINEQSFSLQDAGTGSGSSLHAPSTTISRLMNDWGLDRIDYLKMDIEGAEEQVFSGDVDWLARVDQIKIELHGEHERFAPKIRAALSAHGLRFENDPKHGATLVAFRTAGIPAY